MLEYIYQSSSDISSNCAHPRTCIKQLHGNVESNDFILMAVCKLFILLLHNGSILIIVCDTTIFL